jgi:hypothetical protein
LAVIRIIGLSAVEEIVRDRYIGIGPHYARSDVHVDQWKEEKGCDRYTEA